MYDYLKALVVDRFQIEKILKNPRLDFHTKVSMSTGELKVYPLEAVHSNWVIKILSPGYLLLTGSLHQYWNGGTNENDFTLKAVREAISRLYNELELDPTLASIINLEFGVNLAPSFPVDFIFQDLLCYKNKLPNRPYQERKLNFQEFTHAESYIKLYDKGRQLRKGNLLRIETKGIKARYFASADIYTLQDLTKEKPMHILSSKLLELTIDLVFKDSSIEVRCLPPSAQRNYLLMKDPNEWADAKGMKTSTNRKRETKFRETVKQYGNRDLNNQLYSMMEKKLQMLITA
jgi:hypothetical protein